MITAKIIADSIDPRNNRLTTFYIKFPRIIEAEILRHRMLSFSAASSRAVNLEKHIKKVEQEPFIPKRFTKDCKGMSAREYLNKEYNQIAKNNWLDSFYITLQVCRELHELGVHKQHASRLLQPFEYQEMIVTGTEWNNFFELRCPKYYILGVDNQYFKSIGEVNQVIDKYDLQGFDSDIHNKSTAQPEIQELAELMYNIYQNNIPEQLKENQWHIPYRSNFDDLQNFLIANNGNVDQGGFDLNFNQAEIIISCAKIARISYLTESNDFKKDIDLYNKLVQMKHWSALEHCARVMTDEEYKQFGKSHPDDNNVEGCGYVADYLHEDIYLCFQQGWCNNFKGFIQQRYLVENE